MYTPGLDKHVQDFFNYYIKNTSITHVARYVSDTPTKNLMYVTGCVTVHTCVEIGDTYACFAYSFSEKHYDLS